MHTWGELGYFACHLKIKKKIKMLIKSNLFLKQIVMISFIGLERTSFFQHFNYWSPFIYLAFFGLISQVNEKREAHI